MCMHVCVRCWYIHTLSRHVYWHECISPYRVNDCVSLCTINEKAPKKLVDLF